MKKTFWQTRTSLILAGILLGFAARAILGAPEPDTPVGPSFKNPLPAEVPFAFPLSPSENAEPENDAPQDAEQENDAP